MSDALEICGALCFLAFVFFIWPPLVLLLAGIFFCFAGYISHGKQVQLPRFNLSLKGLKLRVPWERSE